MIRIRSMDWFQEVGLEISFLCFSFLSFRLRIFLITKSYLFAEFLIVREYFMTNSSPLNPCPQPKKFEKVRLRLESLVHDHSSCPNGLSCRALPWAWILLPLNTRLLISQFNGVEFLFRRLHSTASFRSLVLVNMRSFYLSLCLSVSLYSNSSPCLSLYA